GGLLDRRHELAAAPRDGRSRRRRAGLAAAATAVLLVGLGACGTPPPGVTVHPPATSSQRLPLSPIPGQLIGVSAGPDDSAWAAGSTTSGRALIVHWNGAAWSQAASPSPSGVALWHAVGDGPDADLALGRSLLVTDRQPQPGPHRIPLWRERRPGWQRLG